MAILPWEIITDILTRVPVKDLLRFRSVAKPWKSLIDGPDFIKLHLSHSTETTTNLSVILRSDQTFLSFSVDSPAALPIHIPDDDNAVEIIGSRDGLVALSDSLGDMALFNPTTRQYKKIPFTCEKPALGDVVFTYSAIGFGYDPAGDDYKLLRVAIYCETMFFYAMRTVDVYSVKSGSWSSVAEFPTEYRFHSNAGVSVGSTLNWMAAAKNATEACGCFRIVAFDLASEKSSELPLPRKMKGHDFYLKVSELNGRLSLQRNFLSKQELSDCVEVWVMKEYGVGDSWTKLFSVVPSGLIGKFSHVFPVAYLKGKDRFLLDVASERFFLFDGEKQKAEGFTVAGFPESFDSGHWCYVQSLVRVGKCNRTEAQKKQLAGEDGNKRKKQKSGQQRDDFLSKGFKLVL